MIPELHVHVYHNKYLEKCQVQLHMIKKTLKVNTASGTTLGPIGIAPLELSIDDHNLGIISLYAPN